MTKNPQHLLIDYQWFLFSYFGLDFNSKDNFKNFEILRDSPTGHIVKFHISSCSYKSPLSLLESLRFLNNLKISIENKASELISKKCIYYWVHLYRRISPGKIFGAESDTTLALYRNMVECCIQKYGKINCGLEILYGNDHYEVSLKDIASGNYLKALKFFSFTNYEIDKHGVYLGKFDKIDYLNIYIIERLMSEYWHITTCLRRLYKGGKLVINNSDYHVVNDTNTDFLMKSYDERNEKYNNLHTTIGIELLTEEETLNSGCCLIPIYNYKNISLAEYPYHHFFNLSEILIDPITKKPFIPNFLWILFDFDTYFVSNSFIKDEFHEHFGYTLECFVTVMFLIIFRNVSLGKNFDKNYAFKLIQNAYTAIISEDELINELIKYSKQIKLPSLGNYELNIEETKRFTNDIKLNNENKKNISIATLGSRKIILPSIDNKYIIDLSGILDIMLKQTHFIPGKNIGKKGRIFEDDIINKIKKSNLNIWECQKKLKGYDGTLKEIDVSFYDKNVLFICELKCIKRSISYISGDFKALKFRKDKFIQALNDVEDKIYWILNHKEGNNFKIPDCIDAIVPVVISPFIEYIWDIDDYYWISSSVPRICTISELLELLKKDYYNEIIKKPFIKYII